MKGVGWDKFIDPKYNMIFCKYIYIFAKKEILSISFKKDSHKRLHMKEHITHNSIKSYMSSDQLILLGLIWIKIW